MGSTYKKSNLSILDAKNLKSITKTVSGKVDIGRDTIFKKISRQSEKYEFKKTPKGHALTERKPSTPSENETHIYFSFQNYRRDTPVDDTLDKIVFRNDVLEINLITMLIDCLDVYPYLTIIKFEFCCLTARHIEELEELLLLLRTIKELSVNGNPIKEQNYDLLLKCDLICLSLKYCSINAEGMKKICYRLYNPKENPLLHLNIASNFLYDDGAYYAAKFLRMNRKLISLNLADNKITIDGLKFLMEPLQKFAVNDEEMIEKRKIKFAHQKKIIDLYFTNKSKEGLTTVPSVMGSTRKSRTSRSKSKVSERRSTKGRMSTTKTDECLIELPYHPTIQDSEEEENITYCNGNGVLTHLNLSYNRIKKEAITYIIDMLYYQKHLYGSDANSKGITSISVEGNPIDIYEVANALDIKMAALTSVTSEPFALEIGM